jgi:DSF synthase
MGGDLGLFYELIKTKDREKLTDYAAKCIDTLYLNSVNFNLPVTTISLVEGQAMGGGFECALSSNYLIATEDSEMGFPEIKFNLFPGMGAYQFIARSCGTAIADKMLETGDTYSAKELYEMGVVSHLCEKDKGIESVEMFIRSHRKKGKVLRALQKVRRRHHPVEFDELEKVAKLWVETALSLEDKDLRLIERIVKAQIAKMYSLVELNKIRAKQDRRLQGSENTFPIVDDTGEIVQQDRRQKKERRSS